MTSSPSLSYSTRVVMDQPPLPPYPTTITNPNPSNVNSSSSATTTILNCSDSPNSSPRSHQTDNWDEPLPLVPGAKLRLMCSYGGHIIPRPHDKSLSYVGGETRIIVVDRNSSLTDLQSRLSRSLLNGRSFTLKYQLPNEELDSLISVTADEDIENMIEEYDRTMSTSSLKPSRIRLFLFLAKPETAASMGALLADAKSETWFVDALNGADLLHRGVSDSAAIDNLLEYDGIVKSDNSCIDLEANKQVMIKNVDQDVHVTMPDYPMVETSSSFDSSVSSPSMANLPPIKVRVEHKITAVDEQFSQIGFASSAQPSTASAASANSTPPTGDNHNRVISDDERSDKGLPGRLRKPPLPLQPIQRKQNDAYNLPSPDSKHAGAYNLQSPDSVASDSSIASAASFTRHTIHQDPSPVVNQESRVLAPATELKSNMVNPSSQIHIQQVHDQQQQQPMLHASTQYIQHPGTGLVPISSYYPMYAPPTQQQQQQFHQQIDQQYPMYYLPVTHNQPYNVTLQSNIADATAAASSRAPPHPSNVPPASNADIYRTAAGTTPTLFQVPQNQYQQQYFGISQVPPQSQSIASATSATANYGYNYPHPTHEQINYGQQQPTPLPSQYQTMTPASAALLSHASSQLATDNATQQSENHNHYQ